MKRNNVLLKKEFSVHRPYWYKYTTDKGFTIVYREIEMVEKTHPTPGPT